jgi:transcriptional antiterminator NusG
MVAKADELELDVTEAQDDAGVLESPSLESQDEAGGETPTLAPEVDTPAPEEEQAEEPSATVEAAGDVDSLEGQEQAQVVEEALTASAEPEPGAPEEQEQESTEATGAEATEAEAEAEEAVAEKAIPSDAAWYVIHCYSGHESKVKYNLDQRIETMQMQDQIFQVVVPTEDEIEVRDGKRRTVERRVFPGYILVQMSLNDDSWYVVRNTPGVTGFVGMGNEPTPLRSEEVQAIMKRMEAEAPKIKVTFKPGQKVRIIDGPFNEFIGVVDEIDMERAKVRVLVSFFGRETPVELDFLQVEKT